MPTFCLTSGFIFWYENPHTIFFDGKEKERKRNVMRILTIDDKINNNIFALKLNKIK